MLSLSRKEARHWLLDLYSMAASGAGRAPADGDAKASIASHYLRELATRTPGARTTLGIKGGLAGLRDDASAFSLGWSLSESYEAKLTVPERLTLKLAAEADQGVDVSTRAFSLGFGISVNAVISF